MNVGTSIQFKDCNGNLCVGEYHAEDSVVVKHVREIAQLAIAEYYSYDVWKSTKEYIRENWADNSWVWEDKYLKHQTDEFKTFGDVSESLPAGKEGNDRFIAYLTYTLNIDTFDDLFESVEADDVDYEMEWESFLESVGYNMDALVEGKNSSKVLILGSNLNWRGASGHQIFDWNNDAREFVNKLAPNSDFSMSMYDDKDGELRVRCSHHDVPTGSSMRVIPIDDVLRGLSREGKIESIGEWFGYNDKYEDYIWEYLFDKQGSKDIQRHYTKYSDDKLTDLLEWMLDETDEYDYAVEVYIKELRG